MSYIFLQCRNEACRFRFPAERTEVGGVTCPRCRGELDQVATATPNDAMKPDVPPSEREIVALLDNIRSIHNVGSMFRSADSAGISQLYLAGITATPEHPRLKKAALGTQHFIGWQYHPNGVDMAQALKQQGYRLVALERLSPAPSQTQFSILENEERLALVVGNEKAGVDPGILALCDTVLSLPMVGHKSSLNAAVAFGIAVYYLRFGNPFR